MNENYEKLNAWLEYENLEKTLLSELVKLKDEGNAEEINDRFYKELEFGTGGLRGILGAGTNRMNIYTVRKATVGLAKYLNSKYDKASVAIGYDSRINSDLFAETASEALLAYGIDVFLYDVLMPAPAVGFAARFHKCQAGVMITASHNPCKYNGYKVYNGEGCQVTEIAAEEILHEILRTGLFDELPKKTGAKLTYMKEETKNAFYEAVLSSKMTWGDEASMKEELGALSVVYSPLNGAGNIPVREVLNRIGVKNIHIVKEQEAPDGNFPTCPYPNPEKKEALEKGLELLRKVDTDLLIATDPDCDRIGLALIEDGEEILLTGNETGILLFDFICNMRVWSKTMPPNPVLVRTIVSTKMPDLIAEEFGVTVKTTLTGFKYIGEQIGELERNGRKDDYILGFEESYGYLSGTYVRDKDAVNAAMLVCQMAAYYKKRGKTLAKRLKELYEKYGYFKNHLIEFAFEGEKGMHKMAEIMNALRNDPPATIAEEKVTQVIDYENQPGFPKSNVIEALLESGSSFIARPSGTEPKLKIYFSAKGATKEAALAEIAAMEKEMREMLNN